MSIYLDSANPDQVREAMGFGFVAGVTTNPILLAREKRQARELLKELLEVCPRTLFCQLESQLPEEMREEALSLYNLAPDRIALKIPCTMPGLALVAELSQRITCAVTAIFTPGQTILAAEAGARYVMPYVHRAALSMSSGNSLMSAMARVCHGRGYQTEILAASLKSVDEAVETWLNGAHHITVPFDVLQALAEHPLSQVAIEEFLLAVRGAP